VDNWENKKIMNIVCLDFETYYDNKYSLSKITTEEYVRSDEFEAIGVAVQVGDSEPVWFSGTMAQTKTFLDSFDLHENLVIAHNAVFDMFILSHHFGIYPKGIVDTLSMARAIHGTEVGGSLKTLATHYQLGEKGTEVINALGKHRIDFSAEELARYGEYCRNDVTLTVGLFYRLAQDFPRSELLLIDKTIRMFTEPKLELDVAALRTNLKEVQYKKEDLLSKMLITKDQLMSNPQLAEVLRSLGVEPPMKVSLANGKDTYAFSKTDEAFKALLEHENILVQHIVAARLGVKSTLEETRTQRFLEIATRGALPVPLKYYAAHTGRWGGEDKVNLHNLPRGATLKRAIMAPAGYVLVDADSSQIEARTLAWLAEQNDLVDAFENGEDVYKIMASSIYAKDQKDITKAERFLGKTTILGCGYGMGADKFKAQLKISGVDTELDECKRIIEVYRDTYEWVPALWRQANRALEAMMSDLTAPLGRTGALVVEGKKGIRLPNGLYLKYPNLRAWTKDGKSELVYDTKKGKTVIPNKIYGGKLIENCISEGTDVLTDRGWVPIEKVEITDKVHDGVEFVSHGGTVFKSIQSCVTIDGVYMTPNHEVLTDDGWKAASQNPQPYRPDLRHISSVESRAQRREEAKLAVSMPMRGALHKSGSLCYQGNQAWRDSKLRVHNQAINIQSEYHTRHEQTPSVCSMEVNARPMPTTFTPSMGKLWWSGYSRMRSMATRFCKFLGGYGANLHAGLRFRPQGQQWPLFIGELQLGFPQEQSYEQAEYRTQSGRSSPKQGNRNSAYNFVLSAGSWLAHRSTFSETKCKKSVYDIMNAGPRSRFVVMGDNGPFVVHNCCQALARIIIGEQLLNVAKKYRVVLTVHDAICALVPEEEKDTGREYIELCMRLRPQWALDLPLNCESGAAVRYGDC
jgi:DNA polymerase I-like protein with 3'-5' exonuclease and polymerase domains